MPFGRYLLDLAFLLCLQSKSEVWSSLVSDGAAKRMLRHVSNLLKNRHNTVTKPESSENLLSLAFQIFRLISPTVRIFCAKSINYRFVDLRFPSTQNKMGPYHVRSTRHSVSLRKNYHAQTSKLQRKIQFRFFLKHDRTMIKLAIKKKKLSEADNFEVV